jgi:hypothetical protein
MTKAISVLLKGPFGLFLAEKSPKTTCTVVFDSSSHAMTQQLPNFKCKGNVSIFSLFWFYIGIEDVRKVIL